MSSDPYTPPREQKREPRSVVVPLAVLWLVAGLTAAVILLATACVGLVALLSRS